MGTTASWSCVQRGLLPTLMQMTRCGEGIARAVNSRVVVFDPISGHPSQRREFTPYHGLEHLRRAYISHLTRCVDDGANLARALHIGLQADPPRFPGAAHACKRRKIQIRKDHYFSQRKRDRSKFVHGFYLGPLPHPDGMQTDLRAHEDHFIWGPEQIQTLANSPVRAALVKQLL